MKRIYIDDTLYRLAQNYAKDPFARRRNDFERPPKLLRDSRIPLYRQQALNHREYVQKIIIDEYELLNCLKPSQIDNKKQEFDRIVPEADLDKSFVIEAKSHKFYELVVNALRYENLRQSDYIRNSGYMGLSIKTCVYCNAQLAVVVKKTDRTNTSKISVGSHPTKVQIPIPRNFVF